MKELGRFLAILGLAMMLILVILYAAGVVK